MIDLKLKELTRLEDEVLAYEQEKIEEGLIMFYGDSHFAHWGPKFGMRPMEDDIRKKDGSQAVINHGFGTSTAEEQLYYYPRLVKPWKPKALVLKAYYNDSNLAYTPFEIVFLQSRLIEYARYDIPGIRFYLCDTLPIASWDKQPMICEHHRAEYNHLLKEYCDAHPDCVYVDQTNEPRFYNSPEVVGNINEVRKDIFTEDRGHHNQKGYDVYREFFLDVLRDIL